MKKKKVKKIKQKLVLAVEKVLTNNNAALIGKIEKDLKKSIKEISHKSVKKSPAKKKASKAKK